MSQKTKDLQRLKQALVAVQNMSSQQLESLSKVSIWDLRANRIAKQQQRIRQYSCVFPQPIQQEPKQQSRNTTYSRWNIFAETPAVGSCGSTRQYQKQFEKQIDQLRAEFKAKEEARALFLKAQKEKQVQEINKNRQSLFNNPVQKVQEPKKNASMSNGSILNESLFGPSKNKPVLENQNNSNTGLFSSQQNKSKEVIASTNSNPFNFSQNKNNVLQQTSQPLFTNLTQAKPAVSGFFLGQTIAKINGTSIFQKKMPSQQIMPPQPIKPGSGLFSEGNPLNQVKTSAQKINLFSNNNPTPMIQKKPQPSQTKTLFTPTNNAPTIATTTNTNIFQQKAPIVQDSIFKPKEVVQPAASQVTQPKVETKKIEKVQQKVEQKKQKINPFKAVLETNYSEKPSFNTFPGTNLFSQNPTVNNSIGKVSGPVFGTNQPNISTLSSNSIFGKNETANLFNTNNSAPASTSATNLFGNNSKLAPPVFGSNAPTQSKPKTYQSGSLFTNNIKQTTPSPVSKLPQPSPSVQPTVSPSQLNIFGKPMNTAAPTLNMFTSKPLSVAMPPVIAQQQKKQEIKEPIKQPTKQSQIDDSSQKSGIKKKAIDILGDFAKSKPQNMFMKSAENSTPSTNIFGLNSSSTANSIFASKLNAPSEAAKKNFIGDDDQDDGEEGDDGPLEDKSEINPNLSTGNYKYEETLCLFKQTATKLKMLDRETLDNVGVSIEKLEKDTQYSLIVRMPNKTIYCTGFILKNISEVACLQADVFKNVKLRKIALLENGKSIKGEFKIQFKDQKTGKNFFEAFTKAAKND